MTGGGASAKHSSLRLFRGFTLSEVLITLGIIGVVASITIPQVIAKYEKKRTIALLKQTYSMFQQAVKRSEVDNDDVKSWDFSMKADLFFHQYLEPYINIQTTIVEEEKTLNIIYKAPNGTEEISFTPVKPNSNEIISLNNGITLHLHKVAGSVTTTYRIFGIDLNGLKPPNVIGKDFFVLAINKNYGVVPYGYYSSDNGSYTTFNRDYLMNPSLRYGCTKKGTGTLANGAFCLGLIITDGWEIRKDYPW